MFKAITEHIWQHQSVCIYVVEIKYYFHDGFRKSSKNILTPTQNQTRDFVLLLATYDVSSETDNNNMGKSILF